MNFLKYQFVITFFYRNLSVSFLFFFFLFDQLQRKLYQVRLINSVLENFHQFIPNRFHEKFGTRDVVAIKFQSFFLQFVFSPRSIFPLCFQRAECVEFLYTTKKKGKNSEQRKKHLRNERAT